LAATAATRIKTVRQTAAPVERRKVAEPGPAVEPPRSITLRLILLLLTAATPVLVATVQTRAARPMVVVCTASRARLLPTPRSISLERLAATVAMRLARPVLVHITPVMVALREVAQFSPTAEVSSLIPRRLQTTRLRVETVAMVVKQMAASTAARTAQVVSLTVVR